MAFRKRRVATPGYGHVPYNPIHGDQANLRQDGTAPYCAMMQISAADTYEDYVICRGFDTRILKFMNGISVAKPFGKRVIGTYNVGEVYPALLPTQGNDEFAGFRQVTYVPPSPVAVEWRVGQNPGVVTGGLSGGQPTDLSESIEILYDHNGKVVNWLLIDSAPEGGTSTLFLFTLNEDMADGGHSDISNMDGTPVETDVVVNDTLNDFAHLLAGNEGICVKSDGQYYAIHPEAAGNVTLVAFALTSDLTSTATAIVTYTTDSGIASVSSIITVQNPTDELAYAGAVGTAVKIGANWYVIEVNRPEGILQVTFSCDSHDWTSGDPPRGFNGDQTSPITVSATTTISSYPVNDLASYAISNPYNLNWLLGDRGLLRKQDHDDYIVVKVLPAICRRFRFILTGNAPNGLTPDLTTTALCPTNSEGGPPPGGTVTVKDIYGVAHNAKEDHKGVAEFDYNNGWWFATQCQHTSLHFRGKLAATLSGAAATMSVTPEYGLGPGALPSAPTTVYNRHGWDSGAIDDIVRVEWNPELGQYEAYQLDCSS